MKGRLNSSMIVKEGDRIAQLVIERVFRREINVVARSEC